MKTISLFIMMLLGLTSYSQESFDFESTNYNFLTILSEQWWVTNAFVLGLKEHPGVKKIETHDSVYKVITKKGVVIEFLGKHDFCYKIKFYNLDNDNVLLNQIFDEFLYYQILPSRVDDYTNDQYLFIVNNNLCTFEDEKVLSITFLFKTFTTDIQHLFFRNI